MLPEFVEYCRLIADLPNQHPSIQSSTLAPYTIGPNVAELAGQIFFDDDYVLDVWELLDLSTRTIRSYSYALDQSGERVWWYDPQEHPHIPELQSTHPHHKHVHPDVKHNRIPALGISFDQPNLPFLIGEVAMLLQTHS